MIDQIIACGKVEGAGVTAVLESQNMFCLQVRVREVCHTPHMFVRHHVTLGVVPDVSVTSSAHHHGAPGAAADMTQDVVIGGGQLARAAGVEGLLVAQAVLFLMDRSLATDLVLVLNALEMLSKYRGGFVHIAQMTLKIKLLHFFNSKIYQLPRKLDLSWPHD